MGTFLFFYLNIYYMNTFRTYANINICDVIFLNFMWYNYGELYDYRSIEILSEVIPKEAIKEDQTISVSPELDSLNTDIQDCITINLNIDNTDLNESESYYLALCAFFKIEKHYQEKIWEKLIEEVGANDEKILMCCMIKEKCEKRTYDIEIQKLKSQSLYKSLDKIIYKV